MIVLTLLQILHEFHPCSFICLFATNLLFGATDRDTRFTGTDLGSEVRPDLVYPDKVTLETLCLTFSQVRPGSDSKRVHCLERGKNVSLPLSCMVYSLCFSGLLPFRSFKVSFCKFHNKILEGPSLFLQKDGLHPERTSWISSFVLFCNVLTNSVSERRRIIGSQKDSGVIQSEIIFVPSPFIR